MSNLWKWTNLTRRISRRHVLSGLLLGAIVVSFLGPGFSGSLRSLFDPLLAAPADAGMYATIWVKEKADRAGEKPVTPEKYNKVASECDNLRSENQLLRDIILKQEVMLTYPKPLYDKKGPLCFPRDLIAATVVATNSLPYGLGVTISSGTRDGVQKGSPATTRIVVTDRSKAIILPKEYLRVIELYKFTKNLSPVLRQQLVGEIIETSAFTARLRLITDRGFESPASIRRVVDPKNPREYTVMEKDNSITMTLDKASLPVDIYIRGDGSQGMIAANVPEYHAILPGDMVTTLSNTYFLPNIRLPIGIVQKVKPLPTNARFVTLYIKPLADLSTLRDVYIVVPQNTRGGSDSK
ncbi:MAG TPA: hypothetical protein ENL03_06175 [Phycisphaerae bacterium]|nr:hypothetical protein [Phycisphaerae bacterium]